MRPKLTLENNERRPCDIYERSQLAFPNSASNPSVPLLLTKFLATPQMIISITQTIKVRVAAISEKILDQAPPETPLVNDPIVPNRTAENANPAAMGCKIRA